MRTAFTLMVAVALFAGVATGSAGTQQPSIKVVFAGSATGRFVDVERWVLLSSNECYLRRLRDQRTALSWTVGFAGSGRSLAARGAASVAGTVSGTEVRDSCDDVAEELPPEAPADWLSSVRCSDPLGTLRPGRAAWRNGVLRVSAPVVSVARKAACTALPRSTELDAAIPLSTARIAKLKPGATLRITVGSAQKAFGTYRTRANCKHPAKPYDGYRSFDECVDTLTWSGTVTITRL